MKVCTGCQIAKSERDYFIRDKASGRLHAQCKTCYKIKRQNYSREHYLKYGDAYRQRAIDRNKQLRNEYRVFMTNYMKDRCCIDCGETDPIVLELDHRDPTRKAFTISQAVKLSRTVQDILEEIKKCDVVCANCHKKRTAKQFGWYKS